MLPSPATTPLVDQHRLDRGPPPRQPLGQIAGVEAVAERLGPEPREQPVRRRAPSVGQRSTAPNRRASLKRDPRAALDVEHHVVVLRRRRMRVVEGADLRARDQEPPRHPEVHDQRLAAVEIGQQILRPPPQRARPAPRSAARRAAAGTASAGPAGAPRHARSPGPRAPARGRGAPSRPRAAPAHPLPGPGDAVAARPTCLIRSGGTDRKPASRDDRPARAHDPFRRRDRARGREGRRGCTASSPPSPTRYDLMNDAMSLGIHRLWKDATLDWLAPWPGMALLDVAGGTGDIAFRFLRRVKGRGHATVLDMTEDMLAEGRRRAEATRLRPPRSTGWSATRWRSPSPTRASTPTRSPSASATSPASRTPSPRPSACSGPAAGSSCSSSAGCPSPRLRWLYDRYSFNVIPRARPGDRRRPRRATSTSSKSIRRFPDQEAFAAMIAAAGFGQVRYRNLSMGIAALHSAWKL